MGRIVNVWGAFIALEHSRREFVLVVAVQDVEQTIILRCPDTKHNRVWGSLQYSMYTNQHN